MTFAFLAIFALGVFTGACAAHIRTLSRIEPLTKQLAASRAEAAKWKTADARSSASAEELYDMVVELRGKVARQGDGGPMGVA